MNVTRLVSSCACEPYCMKRLVSEHFLSGLEPVPVVYDRVYLEITALRGVKSIHGEKGWRYSTCLETG